MERIDDLQYKNLKIIQNTDGFCFGLDSVLLSEFAKDIKKNATVMDLGTGTGILSILLSKKANVKKIYAVEKQEDVANMAGRSVSLNKLEDIIEVINSDIKDLKKYENKIDAIITNPPYKKKGTGIDSENDKKQISKFESTANLDDWIKVSSRLLKDKGTFYLVYRVARLTELIDILNKYKLEAKVIRYVYAKEGEQSILMLLKAVKNAKPFLKVEKPLIIYNEDGSYKQEILDIYK
jgi:tRNA1Val (adenine37-N6)-methyltransferase